MCAHSMRPVDLARAAEISVASVRFYEGEGFLPAVSRTRSGHRRYAARHLEALLTSRALMAGYGWVYARRVMRAVHDGDRARVAGLVDARHADLHRERRDVEAITAALRVLVERPAGPVSGGRATGALRVGAVARVVDVPVSTLHFWEDRGLVRPSRDPDNGYRHYGATDVRQVRVVAALRAAGYGIERVRGVLDGLAAGDPGAALRHLEQRQHELVAASEACMAATASLWTYIDRFGNPAE